MLTKSGKKQTGRTILLVSIVFISIAILLGIVYVIMVRTNREHAYRTATVMTDQVENMLLSNRRKENSLTESLKENYISKARAIAYIIDHVPGTDTDIAELFRIASLMSIDEIELFDETGTIYSGTVPIYTGYSFDSGEQMAYFKPMLENKALSMCQDVTPNTAEGKSMMYAICWNDAGNRMVQVGIEPLRLLEELRTNQISEVIASLPAYDGTDIIVSDKNTEEIIGSTFTRQIGLTLKEIGIDIDKHDLLTTPTFTGRVDYSPSYCVLKQSGDYIIAVVENRSNVDRDIPIVMITTLLYLLLAVAVITLIVRRMTLNVLNEQKNANTDQLTGLLNRRAYENDLKELETDPKRSALIYVAFDLNGLKTANDTLGHEAGDELLISASRYMKECYGSFGTLYRSGGDEFAGLLFPEEQQLEHAEAEFSHLLQAWTARHGKELSVSRGSAAVSEAPEMSLSEIARLADTRMYKAKSEYYEKNGNDRRR